MGFRMWKKGKTNDYKMFDRTIAESYNIGGVDMWVYTYQGPSGNNGSTDETLPDYSSGSGSVSSIGDLIFGETTQRNYSLTAITIPAVYQVQEATPDLKIIGLMFNFNTMDITVHYNTMMQLIGRKIIPGDIIELPNLRDNDVIGKDVGLNRFYLVQDSFRTSDGYSATWQHHIFKLRVKPLTDSPEYSGLMGDNDYTGSDINNPDSSGDNGENSNSSYNVEMNIMNAIIRQGDNEAPYVHWTNEHIYNDLVDKEYLARYIINGYEFPVKPAKDMFFLKDYYPILHTLNNGNWEIEQSTFGESLPKSGTDGEFFFLFDKTSASSWILYQYNTEHKKWLLCDVVFSNDPSTVPSGDEYYYSCKEQTLYQYKKKKWVEIEADSSTQPFTTKDMMGVKYNIHNLRDMIPPARGTVPEGTQFPIDPDDGMFFYRTDYKPITLWKYSDESKSWTQFDYGGRTPWTGANKEQTDFINSSDRVAVKDILKPNTLYRKDTK